MANLTNRIAAADDASLLREYVIAEAVVVLAHADIAALPVRPSGPTNAAERATAFVANHPAHDFATVRDTFARADAAIADEERAEYDRVSTFAHDRLYAAAADAEEIRVAILARMDSGPDIIRGMIEGRDPRAAAAVWRDD